MALTVEDGTGLTTADSYLSEADADTYMTAFMRDDAAWSGATSAAKEQALREATQLLDALYGRRWVGVRYSSDQSLHWPRSGGVDFDGFAIAATSVPTKVQNATCEMAWRAITVGGVDTSTGDSTKLAADKSAGGNIASEMVKAGSVATETSYLGGKSAVKEYRKIELMLAGYLKPAGVVTRG
jgi:hypothetical protein